ncbi:hypothetical protein GR160_15195 [Flavobacterium sp. Sd200]|uniref:hypothetical protein n=1 Tax=Flavobacterium sp. Sd200 TaxID=2692211 RepID=UPI001371AC9E|nr:hypothetical protein [Flavobacterium sp. Sd200]MXN92573.1 hypothetical protein [Flavobacterium sp. Sd200]
MRSFLFLLSFLSLVTGCKNKSSLQTIPAVDNFRVEMDVNASKKDDFTVYYNETNNLDFSGDYAQWKGIEGGKDETVTIDMPKGVIPTDIRLDFGVNKEQQYVTVKNIKFSYNTSAFTIKGSDFFKFFNEDKNFKTETDTVQGTLKIMAQDGIYKTPYFYPSQQLHDAIKDLTKV